jgi:hypothetical protein
MPSHQVRVRRNYEPEPAVPVTNDATPSSVESDGATAQTKPVVPKPSEPSQTRH